MKKLFKLKKSPAPQPVGPDIAGFMVKIQEQLAALEQKMDSVISRISQPSSRPVEVKNHARPFQPPVQQPVQPPRQNDAKPADRAGRQRGRILHQAVCADCKKDCEIPFKPTGERPVYCKECYATRKSNRPAKGAVEVAPAAEVPVHAQAAPQPQRHVTVTKKGPGKLVISEVIAPSAPAARPEQPASSPRDIPQKGRRQRPARRPRR